MTSEQRLEILKKLTEVDGGVTYYPGDDTNEGYYYVDGDADYNCWDDFCGLWATDEDGRTYNKNNKRLDTRLLSLLKEYA